ncbi:uncharacterized protein LOC122756801 [Drosophila mojavensis]|uniref:uncharacterized protein LOC122756801 n=1 Tax=Drosophila mojavensis TaxID=7230 RepID=UPI001CD08E26|nr:uncharacterized protein LOC122756801 [Drosophila mojavensis]
MLSKWTIMRQMQKANEQRMRLPQHQSLHHHQHQYQEPLTMPDNHIAQAQVQSAVNHLEWQAQAEQGTRSAEDYAGNWLEAGSAVGAVSAVGGAGGAGGGGCKTEHCTRAELTFQPQRTLGPTKEGNEKHPLRSEPGKQ